MTAGTTTGSPVRVYRGRDESYWAGVPQPSSILRWLTQQKEFGQGGQVPTRLWRYDTDTSHPWNPQPNNSNYLLLVVQVSQPFTAPCTYGIDNNSYTWVWSSGFNNSLTTQAAQPFVALWSDNVDIQYAWSWNPEPNNSNYLLLGGQVPTKFWRWDYDSGATQWTWQASGSNTLAILSQFTELYTISADWQWFLNGDQVSQWSWSPEPNNSNYLLLKNQTAQQPFAKPWRWDHDSTIRTSVRLVGRPR